MFTVLELQYVRDAMSICYRNNAKQLLFTITVIVKEKYNSKCISCITQRTIYVRITA